MSDVQKLAKFGVSNFEYGVVGTDDLVLNTKKVPGLSSVKMDIKTDSKTIQADDGPYLVLSAGITEATESIEIYDINSEMKKDFYGVKVVRGVEVYPKNIQINDIATLYRTRLSNGKFIWIGMLKGKFALPSMNSKTVDGAPDPEADSIEGKFIARGDDDNGNVMLIGREDNSDFDFATFHKWVFPATAQDATIAPPQA